LSYTRGASSVARARPLAYCPAMEVRFRLLDVFCDRPFAGNQLCVVPDVPESLDEVVMHTLAREIGFSETTFVTDSGADRYSMRIFTPD
jgi:trans-2,3-dihydro-3-hydroxyanthranilate isomerase